MENNNILIPRRSPEERQKNYMIALNKKIKQYMKNPVGNLNLPNTPIKQLPDNLKVEGGLSLNDTPIGRNEKLLNEYRKKWNIR